MQLSDLSCITGWFKRITCRTKKVAWSHGKAVRMVTKYLGTSSRLREPASLLAPL